MGGVSIVIFGLIAIAGARIWVDNKVDFTDSRNMIVAAITLVLGTGDFTLKFGDFALGGIGTATFGALILNALLSAGRPLVREGDRRLVVVARAHSAFGEDLVPGDPVERLLVRLPRVGLEDDALARPPAPRVHHRVLALGEFVLVVVGVELRPRSMSRCALFSARK